MDLRSYLPDQSFKAPPNLGRVQEIISLAASRSSGLLQEFETYELFKLIGFDVPDFLYHSVSEPLEDLALRLEDCNYVAKCDIPGCIHKSDIGGVLFNINRGNCVERLSSFQQKLGSKNLQGILLVKMMDFFTKGPTNGELLLSTLNDSAFGPCLAFGFGGTTVEYLKTLMKPSKSVIFLPTIIDPSSNAFRKMVSSAPVSSFLCGEIRGVKKQTDLDTIVTALAALHTVQHYFSEANEKAPFIIDELEINPCVVAKDTGKLMALDGVLRARKNPCFGVSTSLYESPKALWKINKLLKPASVIVAGASLRNTAGPASTVLKKFINSPHISNERIYPLHPTATEMFGLKAYSSLEEISRHNGDKIDLFVCGVRASLAESLLNSAIASDAVHSIFVLSGGFGETEEGEVIERRLRALHASLPADKRCVINGPNTLGNFYQGGADTIFTPTEKSSRTGEGTKNCALICQSGAFMVSRLSDLGRVVNPPISVSVGNQLDLTATDFLDHFLNDKEMHQVSTFGVYVEGLGDREGPRLMRLVSEARDAGKLVAIYKAGRSRQGAEAAKGHTASMAGDFNMFEYLLTAAGAVVTQTLLEFEGVLECGSAIPRLVPLIRAVPRGQKVIIGAMSNAGFEKCSIADHLFAHADSERYMALPDYSGAALEEFEQLFKKLRLEGVVDVSQVIDSTPGIPDVAYYELMQAIYRIGHAHIGLCSPVPESVAITTVDGRVVEGIDEDILHPDSLVSHIIRLKEDYADVPLVSCFESGWKYAPTAEHLSRNGVPTFRKVDEASRVISAIVRALRADLM
eukprot:gnl/Chilomastix_cuspidata/767.p1 GENE.gnl/Chilomastix_cuspidata/767~~gnl/Chilomastix_cuspidata/767.p1  ORF type:complete len:814 (+),score=238.62 gnl/Chilomastix_cuspidata/767:38-2443(+)